MEDGSDVLFDSEEVNYEHPPNNEGANGIVIDSEGISLEHSDDAFVQNGDAEGDMLNSDATDDANVRGEQVTIISGEDEIISNASSPIDVSEISESNDRDKFQASVSDNDIAEKQDEPPYGNSIATTAQNGTSDHDVEVEPQDNVERQGSADASLGQDRLTKFPLARIKTIMRTDPDVTITSQETTFLISRATELFIQALSREIFSHTAQAKRRTIQRKDIDLAIDCTDAFAFLEGVLDT